MSTRTAFANLLRAIAHRLDHPHEWISAGHLYWYKNNRGTWHSLRIIPTMKRHMVRTEEHFECAVCRKRKVDTTYD